MPIRPWSLAEIQYNGTVFKTTFILEVDCLSDYIVFTPYRQYFGHLRSGAILTRSEDFIEDSYDIFKQFLYFFKNNFQKKGDVNHHESQVCQWMISTLFFIYFKNTCNIKVICIIFIKTLIPEYVYCLTHFQCAKNSIFCAMGSFANLQCMIGKNFWILFNLHYLA